MTQETGSRAPQIPLLAVPNWAMTYGDRVVLEGLLSQVKPALAIEVGVAQGGSLGRIAAYSEEVHGIDIVQDDILDVPPNATFHLGSSHDVLPELLARFAEEGRNVDFVHVDGDHSTDAARLDLELLLDSPALRRTTILVHDSFSPWVRAGIEAADPFSRPKVVAFEMDLIAGGIPQAGVFKGQPWGGFAMIVVDEGGRREDFGTLQFWSEGAHVVPASVDAWETVYTAEPMIAEIRSGGSWPARIRHRLRQALRG